MKDRRDARGKYKTTRLGYSVKHFHIWDAYYKHMRNDFNNLGKSMTTKGHTSKEVVRGILLRTSYDDGVKLGYRENSDIIRYRWLLRHEEELKKVHPDTPFFGTNKQQLQSQLGIHLMRTRDLWLEQTRMTSNITTPLSHPTARVEYLRAMFEKYNRERDERIAQTTQEHEERMRKDWIRPDQPYVHERGSDLEQTKGLFRDRGLPVIDKDHAFKGAVAKRLKKRGNREKGPTHKNEGPKRYLRVNTSGKPVGWSPVTKDDQ